MGVDEGFDLWPPLTESEEDKELWEFFLNHVKRKYKNDSVMTIDKRGDIVFEVGEHPRLMKDAHRFRRFSAKVSGSHCGNVHVYLRQVEDIAKEYFGWRIVHWSDLHAPFTAYGWDEVYEARGW